MQLGEEDHTMQTAYTCIIKSLFLHAVTAYNKNKR
jgi:hypothetical protein